MKLKAEAYAGILLFVCVAISLTLANSAWSTGYQAIWDRPWFEHSLLYWINDGLMAVFFFQIGLELKREILTGELSNFRKAILPVLAAVGGMVAPALIFLSLNQDPQTMRGWAVPIATDIAFSLGVLSLLSPAITQSLRTFLVTLAVVDDLGAVIIIAAFYHEGFSPGALGLAGLFLGALLLAKHFKITSPWLYMVGTLAVWLCFIKSGLHPTIAGVLSAFTIPLKPTAQNLERRLAPLVSFAILPLFALANASVPLPSAGGALTGSLAIALAAALFLGKPAGILSAVWVGVRTNLGQLPNGASWRRIFGMSCLCGIGFTMSLFIAGLAFTSAEHLNIAKVSLMVASAAAALSGLAVLRKSK